MPRTLVSLGSNLGDAAATLDRAESLLQELVVDGAWRCSGRFPTAPIGGSPGQGPFLNAVAAFDTELAPDALLERLLAIETTLGRRRAERWDARTLDLDLLLYGELALATPSLQVPHPRMTFRPFVLAPAVEVAGDWRHPTCDATLDALYERLRHGRNAVRLLGGDDSAWRDVQRWIEAKRGVAFEGELVVEVPEPEPPKTEPPRLTIDLRTAVEVGASTAPAPGPRLALADCPPEHWRDEVLAALECVWPSEPR